jgi:uncharacterized protein YcnI
MKRRIVLSTLTAFTATLVLAGVASAHAHLTPPLVIAKQSQIFTLAVPTEKAGTTTRVVLTPPAGFAIDSFVPSPGWKRTVQQTGSGEDAAIKKITYSGGNVPTGEDAVFSFLAAPSASKTYTFGVQQTYSDGSVVDWAGAESSDTPAPTIEARSSLGGGGGSSKLAIVALIVGAIALVVGLVSLLAGGRRAVA